MRADGVDEASAWIACDAQTSGGLLVSCAAEALDDVLAIFRAEGFAQAAVIGRVEAGAPGLRVLA